VELEMHGLKTRWFDSVDRNCPLPEYPRPQLVREDWLCLNGLYNYAITDASEQMPAEYDGQILVPFSIESSLSGVEKQLLPEQRLWYRRKFTPDERFRGKQVILHFGAVDWLCKVYINGTIAGGHTGGYCPFSMDITHLLTDGENELVVRVYDPTDAAAQPRGKQVNNPHGFWYTSTSGIWQTVWLEPVNAVHIEKIKITPDIDAGLIRIESIVSGCDEFTIKASVTADGIELSTAIIAAEDQIAISNPKLWSPESPFLYDLTLELFDQNNKQCDRVKSYFGMRKFSIGKDEKAIPRFLLNNKPYFQAGLLDQGYWCDGGLTPPTDEAMVFDIQTMKDLGFNMLRKHIKVEPLRWYYHCDRLGMIVWQDMPNGGAYIGNMMAGVLPFLGIHVKDQAYARFKRKNAEMRAYFETELFEMIDALHSCVSIGCWVPFNEGWGQFDAKQIAEKVKSYDSSRVVDHASGWHDQKGPDLKSVHKYIVPVKLPKQDGRPFVLSEYGGYSRVIAEHVWNIKKCFGYRMFKDKESLSAAYKKLMEQQIIPLVEKGLCATVYTQVSDVENEVNGILTYDREIVKLDEDILRQLNGKLTL